VKPVAVDDPRLAWPVGVTSVAQGGGFAHAMDHGQRAWAIVFLALAAFTGAALTQLKREDPDMLDEMIGDPDGCR
jgi:hypothetical protein